MNSDTMTSGTMTSGTMTSSMTHELAGLYTAGFINDRIEKTGLLAQQMSRGAVAPGGGAFIERLTTAGSGV